MRFICDYLMNTIIFSEMTKDWFSPKSEPQHLRMLKIG